MVTRNEVKKDVLNHLYSLDSEQVQDGIGFIDIDGLGLKILADIGVTKSFTGSILKQFDRVYQFTIKHGRDYVVRNMIDSAIIRENDIDAFLEICKKSRMSVGIMDGVDSVFSGSIAPYNKHMIIRGNLENIAHMQGQIASGQPILETYSFLRAVLSKDPSIYKKMVNVVISTSNFSMYFRQKIVRSKKKAHYDCSS